MPDAFDRVAATMAGPAPASAPAAPAQPDAFDRVAAQMSRAPARAPSLEPAAVPAMPTPAVPDAFDRVAAQMGAAAPLAASPFSTGPDAFDRVAEQMARTASAQTHADGIVAKTPGLNAKGRAAVFEQAMAKQPAPVAQPAMITAPPRPPLWNDGTPDRRMMEGLAQQFGGLTPIQAREAMLTPQKLQEMYLARLPELPAGTHEEQQAAALARSQWLNENPVPDLIDSDPDPKRRAAFYEQLKAKQGGQPLAGALQAFAQTPEQLKAIGSNVAAGVVRLGSKVREVPDAAMGLLVPGMGAMPLYDHKGGAKVVADKLHGYSDSQRAKTLQPGTAGAQAITTTTEAGGTLLPVIGAGLVGGPAGAAGMGASIAGGAVTEEVYQRLDHLPEEQRLNLAASAGGGAGAVALATGGLLGRTPGATSVIGKAVEQGAEGVSYGVLQASAEEAIKSAATGDKPNLARIPTDGGVAGAISVGLSLIGSMLARGKGRAPAVRPEVHQQFEERIQAAKTPADVHKVVDEADEVFRAMEAAIDADDAAHTPQSLGALHGRELVELAREMGVKPGSKSKTVDSILAEQARRSIERDQRLVAEEDAQVERMQSDQQRRAQQERLYREQELEPLRQAEDREAAAELERYEVTQENLAVRTEQQRRATMPRYTGQQLARMPKDQLRRTAEAEGVPYDAPSTTAPRVAEAQERRRLESMTPKQVWDETKARGLKAGSKAANIEALLGDGRPAGSQGIGSQLPVAADAPRTAGPVPPATRVKDVGILPVEANDGRTAVPQRRVEDSELPAEAEGEAVPAARGGAASLRFADGEASPVTYAAVEADALTPSHDARKGFARNPAGDKNERPYHDPREGAASRQTVLRIAAAPDPALLTTDTPTAIDGPPVVRADGVVLGGNARSMGVQLAYHQGGAQAETIRAGMRQAGQKFGINPDELSKLRNPVIVRVIENAGARGSMSRVLNESLTTGKGAATDAVSRANKLRSGTVEMVSDLVADDRTLRDALGSRPDADRIIKGLIHDGVWNEGDYAKFIDPRTDAINEEGKINIERVMVGRIIDDPTVLGNTPPATRTKLMSAMPTLLSMEGKPGDLVPLLKRSIPAFVEWKASGDTLVDHFFRQDRLGEKPAGFRDGDVAAIVNALDALGPRQFRSAVKTYQETVDPGVSMFGGQAVAPRQALRDVFAKGVELPAGMAREADAINLSRAAEPAAPSPAKLAEGAVVQYTDSKGQPAVGRVTGRDHNTGEYRVARTGRGVEDRVAPDAARAVDPTGIKQGDRVQLQGFRGEWEVTQYDPATGKGTARDESSRGMPFTFDRVLPSQRQGQGQSAAPRPAADAPKFFNADDAGASRTGSGLYGQDVADAATGRQTGALFHEPVQVARPARDAADARYAGKFDETATAPMFEQPAAQNRVSSESAGPVNFTAPSDGARSAAPATPDPLAPKLRKTADGLQKHIDDKRREMTQNPTPKRMREYNSRLHDANNLERIQRGLRAIAEAREAGTLPPILADVKGAPDVSPLVRKGLDGGGYYDVIPSRDYSDTSPKGRALQDLIENYRSPELRAADAERTRADRVRELEQRVQFADIEGFFPTPAGIIERMLDAADVRPGMKVLEPSAGKGDIIDLAKRRGVDVDAVEVRPALRELLEAKGHKLVGSDFTEFRADGGGYDRVVMNPPFERGQDIEHVQHAFDQLKPGGRLVAIMSAGSFQRTRSKETAFRQWLDEVGGTVEDLPDGAFTGAGAFRQTGTATKLVTIEKPKIVEKLKEAGEELAAKTLEEGTKDVLGLRPPASTPRNPMRPRGAVDIGPLRGPAHVAVLPARLLKGALDAWSRPLIENVEAQAGEFGPKVANAMRRANDRTREVLGRLHGPAKSYLDAVSGAPGQNFMARRRALAALQEPVVSEGKDYAFSRAQLAVEGKASLDGLSPEAREIVQLRRNLTAEIGAIAVEQGVQVVDPRTGEARPFVPATDGMRWVRAFTPEFYTVAKLPDGHPMKSAVAKAIADANGIEEPVALRQINDAAEGPLFKRNATETVRLLEHFPAWVKNPETGQWVEVLNTDPFTSGRAMVDAASRRLGYLHSFGQDLPGQSVSSDLVEAFTKAGGRQKDIENAVRALNGIPLDHLDLGRLQPVPGTPEYEAFRHVGTVYNVFKSAALTTAAVPNILEPFTKTLALAGVRPWVRAVAAIARHPFASREMTAALGARTVDQVRWITRPGHRIEDLGKAVSDVLTAPLRFVNEWNELHAAQTGVELAKDIRAGKHKGAARVTLEALGFSDQQADRLVGGRASEEEYRAVVTRFAERTQGSTSNPAEKSIAGNSPLWRVAVPFDQWAQMTANRTVRTFTIYGRALRSGDPKRIAHATNYLAKYVFGHAAAGAGAAFLYAWLNAGQAGVEIKKSEAKSDPAGFALEALTNAMLGGAAGRLLRAVESPRSNSIAEGAQSISYPTMMLQDAVEAFNGWGRYKDQEPSDRATAFFRNRFAINRAVGNLMAAWGLTAEDPAREAAVSAFYRWRREQNDLPQNRGGERLPAEDRVPFRRAMRQTLEAMKQLDEPAAQRALAEALKLDDRKSVAQSIRGRKLMNGLQAEHHDRLRKRIGEAAHRKLEAHDDLLEAWAQSVKFESATNPGVHARHGAALLKLDKEHDAVEEQYAPVKKRLTGRWLEDADLLDEHEPLIERRKVLSGKLRELEKIRKALDGDPKAPWEYQGKSVEELNAEMQRVLSE